MPNGTKNVKLTVEKILGNCLSQFSALRVASVPAYMEHAAYKCYVFVEPPQLKSRLGTEDRNYLMHQISTKLPCFSGSCF